MSKKVKKIVKKLKDTLSDLLDVILIGGIGAGLSFAFFQKYPLATLIVCISFIILVFLLNFFFKEKKRCPHCNKLIE